jgi:hypothetical protein
MIDRLTEIGRGYATGMNVEKLREWESYDSPPQYRV